MRKNSGYSIPDTRFSSSKHRVSSIKHRESFLYSFLPLIATAALLTVIQAPINLSFLAWVAYVPFIVACAPEARPRRLFFIGYVTCVVYWMVNLYWVAPVTIAGWLVFCIYTGLLWSILALCFRFCRIKKVPLFIASAVLIVGIERMQGFFLGGFFWRFLAHSQYQNTTIIQIADIFGAGGVSFFIAMVNGLIAELFISVRQGTRWHASIVHRLFVPRLVLSTVLVGAILIAGIAYGRWRIRQTDECVTEGPMAASLQSNVPQSVKRSFESGQELFDGLMVNSKAAGQAGAELIVWPETMVQAILDTEMWDWLRSADSHKAFDKALREHAENNAYLLVGAYGSEVQKKGSEVYQAKYNSAFLYKPDGSKDDKRYDKIHLVPFGEVLPLRRSMAWFYELLMKIKFIPYNFDYSLDYGSNYTIFDMARGQGEEPAQQYKFAVIICYEGTVPYVARTFALDQNGRKRIHWLINISNDGWFVRFKNDKVQPSMELPQHAAVCTFRAVENRLAIVRSVNTGISCMIDSLGRIRNGYIEGTLPEKAMDRMGMAGWFMDRIPIDRRATFFSKYGEWLDYSCQTVLILLIIGGFVNIVRLRFAKRKIRLAGKSHGK